MSLLYTRIAARRRIWHPDAALYLNALETALAATIGEAKRRVINSHYWSLDADGLYPLIGRYYLPIWGNAAANAICLKTRLSGTFVGGYTHASDHVKGNGSTGYFNTGVTAAALGMNTASNMLMSACWVEDTRQPSGQSVEIGSSGGPRLVRNPTGVSDANRTLYYASPTFAQRAITVITGGNSSGILIASSTTASRRDVTIRKGGGTTTGSNTNLDAGTLAGSNIAFGAILSGTTPSLFADSEDFCWAAGLGLTAAQQAAFTLSVKNLAESLTGRSLAA